MDVMSTEQAVQILLNKVEKLKADTLEQQKDSPHLDVLRKELEKQIRKARRSKKPEQALKSLAQEFRRGIRVVQQDKTRETEAKVERRKMREV